MPFYIARITCEFHNSLPGIIDALPAPSSFALLRITLFQEIRQKRVHLRARCKHIRTICIARLLFTVFSLNHGARHGIEGSLEWGEEFVKAKRRHSPVERGSRGKVPKRNLATEKNAMFASPRSSPLGLFYGNTGSEARSGGWKRNSSSDEQKTCGSGFLGLPWRWQPFRWNRDQITSKGLAWWWGWRTDWHCHAWVVAMCADNAELRWSEGREGEGWVWLWVWAWVGRKRERERERRKEREDKESYIHIQEQLKYRNGIISYLPDL